MIIPSITVSGECGVLHGRLVWRCMAFCIRYPSVPPPLVTCVSRFSRILEFLNERRCTAADRQEHVPVSGRVAGPYRIYLLSTPFEIRDRGMPPGPGYVLAFPGSRLCIPASLLDTTSRGFSFFNVDTSHAHGHAARTHLTLPYDITLICGGLCTLQNLSMLQLGTGPRRNGWV